MYNNSQYHFIFSTRNKLISCIQYLIKPLVFLVVILCGISSNLYAQTDYTSSLSGGDNPLSSIPETASGVITGDFDNDGDVDVLAFDDNGNFDSYNFYANDGSGTYSVVTGSSNPFDGIAASDIFFVGDHTYVADFDNDGDQDIWDYRGENANDDQNIYLENTGGSYTSSKSGGSNPLSAIPDADGGVIVGDFDNDGDVDVLAFDDDSYSSFSFYANYGSGSFSKVTGSSNPFDGIAASDIFFTADNTFVADFDGDGDQDIWDYRGQTSGDSQNIYLENTGGSYTSSKSGGSNPLSGIPDVATGVIVGDFDGDGDIDVLAYDDDTYTSFSFYANNGSGSFSKVTGSSNPFNGIADGNIFYAASNTLAADFDNDGDQDIWDYKGDTSNIYLKKQGSPNTAPTDITLSSNSINQSDGTNATVGNLTTTDADGGDTHSYSLVSGTGDTDNGSFNISGSDLRANDASNLPSGSYSVRIQTDDGIDTYQKAFTITVNDDLAPSYENSTPSVSGTTVSQTTLTVRLNEIGTAYYVAVPDGDGAPSASQVKNGQNSSGSAALASGSINISSASQDFTDDITGLNSNTAYDIYVVAQDDEGTPNLQGSATKVDVTTLNAAPTFTNLADAVETTDEDTGVEILFSSIIGQSDANDSDGTVDAFVVQSISSGTLTINGSAYAAGTNDEITPAKSGNWTPDADANGTLNAFSITAKDDAGAESSTAVQAQIDVTAVNDSPVITSNGGGATASLNIAENTTAATTVTASDADGDNLAFALSGGADSALFTIDPNSGALTFSLTPDYESPNDNNNDNVYDVTVSASDGNDTDSQDISITVTDENEAPTFTDGATTTLSVNEDDGATAINNLLEITDDDNGNTLSWSVSSAPAKGSLSGFPANETSSNGSVTPSGLTYTPNADATGSDSFDIQISDGTTSNTITVNVDINARPTVTITSAESDPTNAASFDVTATFNESVTGFDASDITVGNGSVNSVSGSGTTYTITVSPTNDGSVTVDIPAGGATDGAGAGNEAASQFSITYDGTPPAAPASLDLASGSDTGDSNTDNNTNNTTSTINGTAPANTTVAITSDQDGQLGTATADGTGNWSFTPGTALSEANHNITATATDAAGNTSSSSSALSVIIDTSAPNAPATLDMLAGSDTGDSDSDNITSNDTPAISGTAEANSIIEINSDKDGSLGTTTANSSGDWSFTPGSAITEATHAITAQATDAAGNTGSSSSSLSITVDKTSPTTPAAPDLLADSDTGDSDTDNQTNDTTPAFSGSTESNAFISLKSDQDGVIGSAIANGSGDWEITASTLTETTHNITVIVTDQAGNSTTSAPLSLDIDVTAPSSPAIPDLASGSDSGTSSTDDLTNNTTPTINGTAPANTTVAITSDQDGQLGTATANGTGNWSFSPSTALSEATHNITATASDAAGNTSSSSGNFAITIDTSAPQLTASTPSDGATDANYQTDLILTFDEDLVAGSAGNTSIDIYLSDGTLHESIDVSQATITANEITADINTDLTPTKSYYVLVGSDALIDKAGNVYPGISSSGTLTFTVDNTPPTASNDTKSTDEENSVTVDVLSNDSDSEGSVDPSTVTVTSAPANGSTSVNATSGEITYTPNTDFSGSDSFEYTVQDLQGGLSQPATVTITVNGVNDAPVITSPSSVSPDEDTGFAFSGSNTISLTDIDAGTGTLLVSLTVNNGTLMLGTTSHITFTSGTNGNSSWEISGSLSDLNTALASLSYTGNQNFNGSDELNMLVNDQGNTGADPGLSGDASSEEDKAKISLNVQPVNDDPIFSSSQTANIDENSTGVILDVNATDGDGGADDANISYAISGIDSAPFSIDKSSGILSLNNPQNFEAPGDANQDNNYEFTVDADDGVNTVSQTITVSINDIRPAMADQSVGSVDENASNGTVVGTIVTTDDTPTQFVISSGNTDDAFQIDNSGQVLVANQSVIDYETKNQYDFTVETNDKPSGNGISAVISLTINDVDEAPVFISETSVDFPENSSNPVIDVEANDGEGNSADNNITYSLSSADDSSLFTIDTQNGVLSFSSAPDFEQPSDQDGNNEYLVHIKADDGNKSTMQTLTVTVTAVNDAPKISGVPDTNVDEDALYSFTPKAQDPEDDELTFVVANKPDWASFDPASGELSGTPTNDNVGTTTGIEITVSDGNGGSAALAAFDLEVVNTNDAPVVDQGIQDQSATQNTSFTFTIPNDAFSDVDTGDVLSLSVSGLPDGLGFTSSNSTITGTPTSTDLGSNTIQVTATDKSGATVSTSFELSVTPETPGQVVLATPTDASIDVGLTPELQWKALSSARTYELQLSTSKGFAKGDIVINKNNISQNNLTVSTDLDRNTTYYWRVRGHNYSATGDWSKAFSFTTIPEVPQKVVLKNPANQETDLPVLPTLQWAAADGSVTYDIRVARDNTFNDVVVSKEITEMSYAIKQSLDLATTYYWQVRGTNTGGNGQWSDTFTFTTIPQVPEQVSLVSPTENAGSIARDVTLKWDDAVRADSYAIEIATDQNFTDVITAVADLSNSQYLLKRNLQDNTQYFWRVQASNSGGTGKWSKVWSFTTKATAPQLTFPGQQEEGISIAPQLAWSADYEDTRFHLRVSSVQNFKTLVIDTLLNNSKFSLTGLETNTTYYWQARVETEATTGPWAAVQSFTTRTPPQDDTVDQEIVFGDNGQDSGDQQLDKFDYRLVGLPGSKVISVEDLFEGEYGTNWKVFKDDGSAEDFLVEHSQKNPLSFRTGNGYWVLSKNAVNIQENLATVEISENDTYSLTLNPGWNIVSNPFNKVADWNQVQAFNNQSMTLYAYEGSFSEATEMVPFKGYYVYNDSDATLALSIPYTSLAKRGSQSSPKKKKAGTQRSITLSITGAEQNISSALNIVYPQYSAKKDSLNQYHPPLELSKFGATFVEENNGYRKQMLKTLADSFDEKRNHYKVSIKSTKQEIIRWEANIRGLDKGTAVLVVDAEEGRTQILHHGEQYPFMSVAGYKTFDLYIGSEDELSTIKDNLTPHEITLKQNYPNPFNPTTTIQFGLDKKDDVQLEVFDILGRKVQTLVNETRSAGWHKVSFNGSRMASGTYFYRLVIGQQIKTRKMILIK
ncbi:Ig-like domain-containing protein [Fodinibius halophilus]|uniref:Tandem-95 repeat protein n=1 Tax=Fodinibius halophilus TaxID=1736908 RepID=A0A6M1T121_9BACT|nr:Ig-like domain-containing protein [Fodinibius halophilus]NGP87657.1 tandem-95 repeat protein [Fodinibius halophilus]